MLGVNKYSFLVIRVNSVFHCRHLSKVNKKGQTPSMYCTELVRKLDYENYLCTLLLPNDIRGAGFAIRAFNVEVAQASQVREPTIGAMRLQFWFETLNKIYDDRPPQTPVALELHRILKKHSLSKHYFKRLIKARFEKMSNMTFPDLQSLENYSENIVSPTYYLLLEAIGIKNVNADHVASHLGKAHGIVNMIRSIPYNAQRRISVLPQQILMKNNISTEAVLQMKSSSGLNDSVFEVASCANQHLDLAVSLKNKVQKEAHLIFLPLVCVETYLEQLRHADFNVFNPKLQQRNNMLPFKLVWRKFLWKLRR